MWKWKLSILLQIPGMKQKVHCCQRKMPLLTWPVSSLQTAICPASWRTVTGYQKRFFHITSFPCLLFYKATVKHTTMFYGCVWPCFFLFYLKFLNDLCLAKFGSLVFAVSLFSSFQAKLPRGIHQVRPHLKNIDNVPLLVPLFTDCTPESRCLLCHVKIQL